LDRITGGLAVTDTNHSQVHAGNAFSMTEHITVASGAYLRRTVTIPDGIYVHFQEFEASLEVAFDVKIIEGDDPTIGTEYTPIARNRVKNDASALTVHDTLVTANTTTLFHVHYPATKQGGSGVISDGIEWVLNPGHSYTFEIYNHDNASGDGYFKIDWYEEGSG
jgi:hypothetical protein